MGLFRELRIFNLVTPEIRACNNLDFFNEEIFIYLHKLDKLDKITHASIRIHSKSQTKHNKLSSVMVKSG